MVIIPLHRLQNVYIKEEEEHGQNVGKKSFSKISIYKPNNCFYLSNDNIVILTAEKGESMFSAKMFSVGDMDSFFKEPENSKHFGICLMPANFKGKNVEIHC